MGVSNLATVAYIFKRKYTDRGIAEVATRDHPTMHLLTREGEFTGTEFAYPIRYAHPQGVSGTFAAAKAAVTGSKGFQPKALRKTKYGLITLDGEAMAACASMGAFVTLVTQETDGILEEMGDAFAFDLFRDGTGRRGQRLSAAGNVVTLSQPTDVRNFKEGLTVMASPNADGSAPRVGTAKVAAIDEDGGTITLDNIATIAAFANNDFLFRNGDPGTCMEGMEVSTPLIAPVFGVDSFRGMDRGRDVRGLAGSRVPINGDNIEENFGRGAVNVSTRGKKLDRGALHPLKFWEVVRRLNAKVEYQSGGGTADYGFEYIMLHTPGGTIKLYSDPDCPIDRGRGFRNSAHYIKHLNEIPHIIRDDGKPSMREVDADGIEIRCRGWLNYLQNDTASHLAVELQP